MRSAHRLCAAARVDRLGFSDHCHRSGFDGALWTARPFSPLAAGRQGSGLRCAGNGGDERFADRQISQLSGGQQQRLFLARALVQNASPLHPRRALCGVDLATEKAIIELLRKLENRERRSS